MAPLQAEAVVVEAPGDEAVVVGDHPPGRLHGAATAHANFS